MKMPYDSMDHNEFAMEIIVQYSWVFMTATARARLFSHAYWPVLLVDLQLLLESLAHIMMGRGRVDEIGCCMKKTCAPVGLR